MQRCRRAVGAVSVCLFAALLSAGCAKKVPITTNSVGASSGATSSSVTPTAAVMPPVDGSGSPITSPISGTKARTELMDAARKKLGTTSEFVVSQIYVQGSYALGDLETVSGGTRQFVAFKGPEWEAVWVAPFNASNASATNVMSAVPGLSEELATKVDWKFAKPASDAAMSSSLKTAAKGWAKTLMGGLGEPYEVMMAQVAQDDKGQWWGRAVVQPASSASGSYESIDYWCKYSGGTWTGKAQDPEPPAPTTYFPLAVVGALGF
ncbi:MAG: hypothetical protein WCJ13_00670 [Coriobacteriia bacterium]